MSIVQAWLRAGIAQRMTMSVQAILSAILLVATTIGFADLMDTNLSDGRAIRNIFEAVFTTAVSVAVVLALLIGLHSMLDRERALASRFVGGVAYVFFAFWSVAFSFGFFWKIFSSEDFRRAQFEREISFVLEQLDDHFTALSSVSALATEISNDAAQSSELEESIGGTCENNVQVSQGNGPLAQARRSIAADSAQTASEISEVWLEPLRSEAAALAWRVRALDRTQSASMESFAPSAPGTPNASDPAELSALQRSALTGGASLGVEYKKVFARANSLFVQASELQNTVGVETQEKFQRLALEVTDAQGRQNNMWCKDERLGEAFGQASVGLAELPRLQPPSLELVGGAAASRFATMHLARNAMSAIGRLFGFEIRGPIDEVPPEALIEGDYFVLALSVSINLSLLLVSIFGRPVSFGASLLDQQKIQIHAGSDETDLNAHQKPSNDKGARNFSGIDIIARSRLWLSRQAKPGRQRKVVAEQRAADMLRKSSLNLLVRSLDTVCLGLALSLLLPPVLTILNHEATYLLAGWAVQTSLLFFALCAVSVLFALAPIAIWWMTFQAEVIAKIEGVFAFRFAPLARALSARDRAIDLFVARSERFSKPANRWLVHAERVVVQSVAIGVLLAGAASIAIVVSLLQLADTLSFVIVGATLLALVCVREKVRAIQEQVPLQTRWATSKSGWLAIMVLTPLAMGFAAWSTVNFEAGRLLVRASFPISAVTHGVDTEGTDVAVAADYGGTLVFVQTNVLKRLELGDDRPITKLIWSPSPLLKSNSEFETSEGYSSRNVASLEERQRRLNAVLREPPLFRPEDGRIILSAYQARVLLKEVRPYKARLNSVWLPQMGGSLTVSKAELGPELDADILSKIEIHYSQPTDESVSAEISPVEENVTLSEWLASVQAGTYPLDPTDPYMIEASLSETTRTVQPGVIAVREGEVLWWDGDEELGPVSLWQGRGTPIVHLRPSGRLDILGEIAIEDISAFIGAVLSDRDPYPWTIKTIDLLSGQTMFTLLGSSLPVVESVPTSLLGEDDSYYIVGLSDGALLRLDVGDVELTGDRAARSIAQLLEGSPNAIFGVLRSRLRTAGSDTAVLAISRIGQEAIVAIHADETASRFWHSPAVRMSPFGPVDLSRPSLEFTGTLDGALARQIPRHPFPYEHDGVHLVIDRATDANDLARKVKISGFSDVPAEIARLDDGRLIVGGWDGRVRMVDLELAERLNDFGPDRSLASLSTGFARASDQVMSWVLPSAVSWPTKTRVALENIEPANRALSGAEGLNRASSLPPLPAFAAGSVIAKPLLSTPEPQSSVSGADDPSRRTPVSRSIIADQTAANDVLLAIMSERGLGGQVSLSRQGVMVIETGATGESQNSGGLPSLRDFSALDCSPTRVSENAEAATLCLIQDISASGEFEYAEPDWIFEVQSGPARAARNSELERRPLLGWQWALTGTSRASSSFEHSWAANAEGEAVTVAVIDTGVDWQNPLMDAPFLRAGWDMVSDPLSSSDGDGRDSDTNDPGEVCQSSASRGGARYHGTQLVSVIAGVGEGGALAAAANNVDIVPVRAFGNCGGRLSDINDAIRWSAGLIPAATADGSEVWNEYPAEIILLAAAAAIPCPASLQEAINEAAGKGSIVVVAAGNAGRDAEGYAPANCENVVTAAASDAKGRIAPYSNFGPSVSLLAPGGDLKRDDNHDGLPDGILAAARATNCKDPLTGRSFGACNLGIYEGTSLAAAHTAAALAQLKSQSPLLSSAELVSRLLETATQPASEDECPLGCGAGRLDLSK